MNLIAPTMKCSVCMRDFKDILKHLRKSSNCESEYDIDRIVAQRRLKRLETMRTQKREKYDINRNKLGLSWAKLSPSWGLKL